MARDSGGVAQTLSPGLQLSRVRTFLFWALACVWFTEMVFLGFSSFSKVWASLWQVVPPHDPQLATALHIRWAVAAPAKGALGVMAVFGLRSKNPSVRTALFASMALVPPLNIAFPFRQQGFLFGPVAVATVLSGILWGSFFLFKESAEQPETESSRHRGLRLPPQWEQAQDWWFGANAAVLTLLALVSLLWPRSTLTAVLPCWSSLLRSPGAELSSLIHTGMASGTHLAALATATWLATAHGRRHPALRNAVAVASTVHAGLMGLFPLRQIALAAGGSCATASILVVFLPLLLGWVFYLALSSRAQPARTAPLRA